jgi:DNA-binding protein Fis
MDDTTLFKQRFFNDNEQEITELIENRISLFDAIENKTIEKENNSYQRELSRWSCDVCYVCKEKTIAKKYDNDVEIRYCPKCGWWESQKLAFLESKTGYIYDSYTILRRAVLKQFQIFSDDIPFDALISHINKYPEQINKITPKKLELLIKSVFEQYFKCDVIHVGGPSDGGYDLVLVNKDNPILVQVKQHYDPNKVEPISYIREFIGTLMLEEKKKGMFVSTASSFSKPVYKAIKRIQEINKINIELFDASKIIDILKLVKKDNEAWEKYGANFREYSYKELLPPEFILTEENLQINILTNISKDILKIRFGIDIECEENRS